MIRKSKTVLSEISYSLEFEELLSEYLENSNLYFYVLKYR
jgi:hypothetical protein